MRHLLVRPSHRQDTREEYCKRADSFSVRTPVQTSVDRSLLLPIAASVAWKNEENSGLITGVSTAYVTPRSDSLVPSNIEATP